MDSTQTDVAGTVVAVVVMLASSATYALSFVLQHKGTQAAMSGALGVGETKLKRLFTSKVWILGVVLFGVAFALHLVALAFAAVAVVQPLIVTELIFIPPISALITKTKISGREWFAIVLVSASLAAFLIAAAPNAGGKEPSVAEWIALIVGIAVVSGLLVFVGERLSPTIRAALCGVAAGLVNAQLALVASGAFSGGGGSPLTNPLVYVTVLTTAASVGMTAVAFRSGPITTSSPAMIAVNPIAAVLLSLWLFGDSISDSPVAIAVITISIVVAGYGIIVLTKAEADIEESLVGTLEEI